MLSLYTRKRHTRRIFILQVYFSLLPRAAETKVTYTQCCAWMHRVCCFCYNKTVSHWKRSNQSSEVISNRLSEMLAGGNTNRMRNLSKQAQLLQYLCVMWYLLYKQYWFRWFSHRFQFFQLYRASEELKCSVKSKSYQSRGVRYFPSLSCSQDPTVSQTELLTKQVPPPCCLALWVPRKGVR